jgi:uncharacterized protein
MRAVRAFARLGLCLAALAFWLLPRSAWAFTPPPAPADGTYVVDTAGKLSAADKDEIDRKLVAIKQAGGPWIAVFVASSLEGESIDDVGITTFRAWKIGSKDDNGVLLLIAPNERKVRIDVGKHLEGDLTDLDSNDIIRTKIGPHLKQDDFRGGIDAGIDGIATAVMHGAAPGPRDRRGRPAAASEGVNPFQVGAIAVVLIVLIILLSRRRGGGGGGGGFWWWGGGGGGGWGGGGGGDSGWGGGGGGDSGPSGGGDAGGGGSSDSY